MSVWLDKTQPLAEDEMTEAQWLGLLVENAILDGFEEQTGLQVIDRQAEYVGDKTWHKATPDGWVVGAGPVDAKFIGDAPWNDDGGPDGIPDHYAIQVQWQMHCSDALVAYLVVIHTAFGRRQFRIYRVPRDQRTIDHLVTLVDRFWLEYVEPKKLPPVDGSDATAEAIKVLYPRQDDELEPVEVDATLAAEYRQAQQRRKDAEAHEALCKQRIQDLMGTAAVATVDGKPAFTWKAQTTRRLDTKAIEEVRRINPRALAWLKPSVTESRVFRQKGKV